ncbi:MAG: hypothetical protein JWR67_675 [Mucilaginibacter sp.]|nr:hypothetical protein [Mucilaginibacter sp.]
MLNQFLFVYGTLLESGNEFALYLQNNSTVYAKGKFKGRLYDIDKYPGAVDDPDYEYDVYGSICLLKNPSAALKHIDQYEGFGIGQPQPYLFIRKLIKAVTDQGLITCWVYIYNLPITGLHQISSGDYLTYKEDKKNPSDF